MQLRGTGYGFEKPKDLTEDDVANARLLRGQTVEDMARYMGVRPATFSAWEGGIAAPQARQRRLLSQILCETSKQLKIGAEGRCAAAPAISQYVSNCLAWVSEHASEGWNHKCGERADSPAEGGRG